MLSMQHAMLAYRARGKDVTPECLGGTLFPDAIRAYSGPRPYSHFERSDDGRDVSWWHMPTDMKHITKDMTMLSLEHGSHLAKNAKAPFGQETDVRAFIEHNGSMAYQKDMYRGVLAHLSAQDVPFDAFVRSHVVDMSEMGKGKLYAQGDVLSWGRIPDDVHLHRDGTRMAFDSDGDARRLVTHVEMQGIYVLAKKLYEERGITCDQAWFDGAVSDKVHEAYPQDLADKTMAFMKVDPEVSELVKAHDFSKVDDGPLPSALYDRLYREASRGTEKVYETGQPAFVSMASADRALSRQLPDVSPEVSDDKEYEF